MKIEDVRNLKPGDQVYWNDPDDGIRSGIKMIRSIEIQTIPGPLLDFGDGLKPVRSETHLITIISDSGGRIECRTSELSRPSRFVQ